MVIAQISSVRDDLEVAAAKTGMLATAAIIESLRQHLIDMPLSHLVIDPVMVATTGAWLLEGEARESYLSLLPHADLITPNLPEAAYLTDQSVNDKVSMVAAAYALYELGARHVLIKGGHLVGEQAEDLFFDGDDLQWLSADRVATRNVHGTGCTLSAAITANLALGFSMLEAIDRAKRYLTSCLNASVDWRLGHGAGAFARLSVEAAFDQE
jgi:hydroxymethylpyrimidine/phosphomethylpyrimidine kinase